MITHQLSKFNHVGGKNWSHINSCVYMIKKQYSWKRHYWCLFFIEWIEMPVMPDISAHWAAGWRTRVQQLLEHDQSMWKTKQNQTKKCFCATPLFYQTEFETFLCMTLVLCTCCWLLGLWSLKGSLPHPCLILIWKSLMNLDIEI